MSYIKFYCCFGIVLWATVGTVQSMVYDNRWLPPLFESPRILINGFQQRFTTNLFVMTGNRGIGVTDESIGIPEVFGEFDMHQLAEALTLTGRTNPLPFEVQLEQFPFRVIGKTQAQGIDGLVHLAFDNHFSFGGSWVVMRVNSTQHFFEKNRNCALLTPNQVDMYRRLILSELGFVGPNYNHVAFGDSEWYMRIGKSWDYTAKMRYIDAGARLGVLIPSGAKRNPAYPSSLPFGGDGMWGMYGSLDGLFEVKEDLKVGMVFRLNKRFPRTFNERMSVNGEPWIFGATCGLIKVNPGVTFIWSPIVMLENIRAGLGIGAQYHLTYHQEDDIVDMRLNKSIPVNLNGMKRYSKWGADYVTVDVMYDFGKELRSRSFAPVLSFRVDIPAYFFVTEHVPQIYRISLGIEFDF